MSFFDKLFAATRANTDTGQPVEAVPYDIDLVPNKSYRTTRQMYLFSEQAVVPDVNDYVLIDAVVTFLERGESLEDNRLIAPWVRVRSAKGKEGWCFAHYLVPATEEDLAKARRKGRRAAKDLTEHWARADEAIAIWNAH